MLVRLDLEGGPLFEQIAASVRADLLSGRLRPGDRLPAAREVADAIEVNVHTVLRAYQELRSEGLLDLRRGRGAVVSASAGPLAELADDISKLIARGAELGVSASTIAALIKERAQ